MSPVSDGTIIFKVCGKIILTIVLNLDIPIAYEASNCPFGIALTPLSRITAV